MPRNVTDVIQFILGSTLIIIVSFTNFINPNNLFYVFMINCHLNLIVVDEIYRKGRDPHTQEYSIPQHLVSNIDVLRDQLKLLERLNTNEKKLPKNCDVPSSIQLIHLPEQKFEVRPSTSKRPLPSSDSFGTKVSLQKRNENTRKIEDYISVVAEQGKMAEKLLEAAPYNIFFTAITDSVTTHTQPLTITFQGKILLEMIQF